MTPALWAELVTAIVPCIIAATAYLRANTAKHTANSAQNTALTTQALYAAHVDTLHPQKGLEIMSENPEAVDSSLSNPVGLQGASLMGVTAPPAMHDPAPPPVEETVPDPEPESEVPANPIIIADPANTDDVKIYSKDDLRRLLGL